MAAHDGEAPALKNLPIQDLSVTVQECIAPTSHLVIVSDNDPCFEGGVVVPTDEIAVSVSNINLMHYWYTLRRLRNMQQSGFTTHRSPPSVFLTTPVSASNDVTN